MGFKFGALLIVCVQVFAAFAEAACPCTREYRPLCGSDGNTYNNPCLLRCAASTSGREIKMVKPVACDDPVPETDNCICTYEYAPVCGTDGRTYPNECGLKCHGLKFDQYLKVEHRGACETAQEPTCACIFLYKPVCGTDGKTYSNGCAMNCAAKTNSMLRFAHDGPCEDSVEVQDV